MANDDAVGTRSRMVTNTPPAGALPWFGSLLVLDELQLTAVPEPSTWALSAAALGKLHRRSRFT